jgi:hypothetical protein
MARSAEILHSNSMVKSRNWSNCDGESMIRYSDKATWNQLTKIAGRETVLGDRAQKIVKSRAERFKSYERRF